MNRPSLGKIIAVCGTCAALTILAATINIGLGIVAMLALYGVADSLLS